MSYRAKRPAEIDVERLEEEHFAECMYRVTMNGPPLGQGDAVGEEALDAIDLSCYEILEDVFEDSTLEDLEDMYKWNKYVQYFVRFSKTGKTSGDLVDASSGELWGIVEELEDGRLEFRWENGRTARTRDAMAALTNEVTLRLRTKRGRFFE